MAKVSGPLFSVSATGTIGKAFTFGTWKGIPYVREHFTPANPNTAEQVNLRTALRLAVAYWQSLGQANKDAYDAGASGQGLSGYNLYMKRAMNSYVSQLGTSTLPVSVSSSGIYPDDVFTWSDV